MSLQKSSTRMSGALGGIKFSVSTDDQDCVIDQSVDLKT